MKSQHQGDDTYSARQKYGKSVAKAKREKLKRINKRKHNGGN